MRRLSLLAFVGLAIFATLRGCADWADDCTLNDECCPDGGLGCFEAGTGGEDGGSDAG